MIWIKFKNKVMGKCPYCKKIGRLEKPESMTVYVNEKGNETKFQCKECAQDYREHWQERWDDYYKGLL